MKNKFLAVCVVLLMPLGFIITIVAALLRIFVGYFRVGWKFWRLK